MLSQLEDDGELSVDKLAAREAMTSKKRRKYSDAIVERWVSRGLVKKLWRDFQAQVGFARMDEDGAGSGSGRWRRD